GRVPADRCTGQVEVGVLRAEVDGIAEVGCPQRDPRDPGVAPDIQPRLEHDLVRLADTDEVDAVEHDGLGPVGALVDVQLVADSCLAERLLQPPVRQQCPAHVDLAHEAPFPSGARSSAGYVRPGRTGRWASAGGRTQRSARVFRRRRELPTTTTEARAIATPARSGPMRPPSTRTRARAWYTASARRF